MLLLGIYEINTTRLRFDFTESNIGDNDGDFNPAKYHISFIIRRSLIKAACPRGIEA